MSEAFKQPPAQLPTMYLSVSPVLPSVIPRPPVLITFLFAFLINTDHLFLACASRDCLQAPCPLCMWVSPKELFTTTMLAKSDPLIVVRLRVFVNASVFRR